MQVSIMIWIVGITLILSLLNYLIVTLEKKEKMISLQWIFIVCVFFFALVGFLFPFVQMVDTEGKEMYVSIQEKDGELIVRKPYHVVLMWDEIIERKTEKNPEIKEIDIPITSKEGDVYNISVNVHQFYVQGNANREKENQQFAEKIKEATKENVKETMQEDVLIKMIQEEIKHYTSEELQSKLFLAKQLKEVEKQYNKEHFLQIKLFI